MSIGVPPVCACTEGAYIGTQRAGAPVCCERCGRITLEQLVAIRRPVEDALRAQMERMRQLAELGDEAFRMNWRNRLEVAEADVERLREKLIRLRRKYGRDDVGGEA